MKFRNKHFDGICKNNKFSIIGKYSICSKVTYYKFTMIYDISYYNPRYIVFHNFSKSKKHYFTKYTVACHIWTLNEKI